MTLTSRVCPLALFLASCAHALVPGNGGGIDTAYGKMPLTFESLESEAGGQRFITRISGRTIGFAASGAVTERRAGSHRPETVMRFVGARIDVQPETAGPQSGTANYLRGSRPELWRTGVPLFRNIAYRNLYPGIDVIYYGNQRRLEYDLVVAPKASWHRIRLAFGGAQKIEIDPQGNLRLLTRSGWVMHERPVVYQRVGDVRRQIFGRYVRKGGNEVGFEIAGNDPSLPIVIDPTLAFSSYLGGSGDDYGHAVAVDGSGYAYVVGETGSMDFPTQGPEQPSMDGDTDVFVTKWNPAGTGLVYSTYIGGCNRDVALDVAVDSSFNAYVGGFTYSADFPITKGALRTSFMGDSKAFVLKLNPTGNALIYSTFLGGSGDDYGASIAVDAAGEAHIAGYTVSVDFPTTAGAFQKFYGGGSSDGFVAKLNAAGSALIFASYLGGLANDTAAGVALDPAGNIFVTGQTQSSNFPTLNPVQPANSESDAFVVKMNASGQALYSTYLGGTGFTNGTAIAADAAGNAYITGFTNTPDFPVTAYAYQCTNNGSYDAFVAVLNPYGSSILGATYLGGSGSDSGYGIALDGSGNIYVTGATNSIDFPLFDAMQAAYNGGGDAFVAALNSQLTGLVYATFFGGSGNDFASAIAVDSAGSAYITGWTNSGGSSVGFPITPGAFQTMGIGGIDAFVAKLAAGGAPLSCTTSAQALTVQAGSPLQLVGDLLLSCTGGTAGTQVTANILAALSAPAAGSQPEIFVGSGTTPLAGVPNGNGAILFQGISFAAPGPSVTVPLRITNFWASTAAMAPGGQIGITLAVQNTNPSLTVAPAQQVVAITANPPDAQIQQVVLSKMSAPANCVAPASATSFLSSDATALVWLLVGNAAAGDVARVDWSSPLGGTYQSHSLTAAGSGTQCLWDTMNIAGTPPAMAGTWTVQVYWNGVQLTAASFVVLTAGANVLVWQNSSTEQVTKHCFSASQYVDWAWLNPTGNPGWSVVAAADMNGDGVTDLIWQNKTTRQVTVNYYGGTGGDVLTGWAWLNQAGNPGWTVVAAADMNGDGVPDLIWQNDATRQVTVNYYGGPGGTKLIGWAWLNQAGNPGWTLVAAADMNGDGVPDLIWQNDTTRQATVNYYGGSGGATLTGWAWLNIGGNIGWTLVGASDFNGDGVPDLVWQNNSTGQVTVNYYGGPQGTTLQGWAWLEPAGFSGWRALVTP